MKFKGKVLSAIIAGTMTVTAFGGVLPNVIPEVGQSIQVSAAGESLSLSSAEGRAGETVTLSVNIACNNNFESLDTTITWEDTSLVAAAAISAGEASCASDVYKDHCVVFAYGSDNKPLADGSIVTIDFTIPEDAVTGTVYNINFASVNTFKIFKGDDIAEYVPIVGGTITVVGSEPEPVIEVSEYATEGTCGEGLTWKLSSDGVLTISGKGNMNHSFSNNFGGGYSSPWKGRTDIKSVVVEKGVLSISYDSFTNCTELKSVTLPEGLKTIGDTFEGCTSLTKMNIPESVEYLAWRALLDTPLVQNQTGDIAYVGNWAVGIEPDINNAVFKEGTTDIAMGLFQDCSELGAVSFPDSLKAIHVLAFYNCDSLTSVTIPENVKIYRDVFGDCDNLKEVTISEGCSLNLDEDCGGRTMVAFFNCKNLEKVTILEDDLSELWFGKDWSDEYGDYQDISNITIYGHSDSQAEKAAKEKGYKFEAIDDKHNETTPVGDANGDNKLNVRDAAFIAAKLAQGKASELPESADFNGDGKVNVRDAAAIAKFLATGEK